MFTVHGKEVTSKDKTEFLRTFAPHDSPAKKQCIEDLEDFLAQVMEELGEMRMNNFKKRCNCVTAVKRKSRSAPKVEKRK